MDILGFLGKALDPIARIIDEVHTSDEERMRLQNELQIVRAQVILRAADYERDLLNRKADVIMAEAKGESWLQRSWRPLLMVTFAGMIVSHWMGWTAENLTQETVDNLYALVKIGVGGYIVGRSAEKVAPNITRAFASKSGGSNYANQQLSRLEDGSQ